MALTLNDITPVGLCLVTQDLFDARRFQTNFCDNILMRSNDMNLQDKIVGIKRELNSFMTEKKFIEGHKTVIVNNIDKIISLVSSRFAEIDLRTTENVVLHSKDLMEKVLVAQTFDEILSLHNNFKSNVTLPVYELFLKSMKKSKISMV
jgi:hypothetical protein